MDFQKDLGIWADPRKSNYELVIETAKGMTEQEIIEVSAYLESMKWTQWIDVIETNTVPKTYLRGGLYIPIEGPDAGTEPIGKRIIESPVDSYKTEFLRDPRSSFVAHVPEGSIEKGAQLVLTGKNGKTI
ncbi:hypothetical protein [Candidatus Pelagisphaera phototrophica]|uniref:hypothetical protein n=1 Tax=Candidatus Pelagisphaera phototrophica TaxID=2684113 RepID=UPI0024B85F2A|nr:hypothetical protein [Candidatus Pelagisphaera phototrophica]QXD30860.1 hypothetical protein GA004_10870 [Candidatus Pelagisphaera phototrophica]